MGVGGRGRGSAPGRTHAPLKEPSRMYRNAMAVCRPAVAWWGRLEVEGLDSLPERGPVLVVGNHYSHWDPVTGWGGGNTSPPDQGAGQIDAWDVRGLRPVLDGMGQIPIERSVGDRGALSRAIEELWNGACIGVFPEGTRSRGEVLRALSGGGRLALEVPEAHVSLVAIEGTSDLTGFP